MFKKKMIPLVIFCMVIGMACGTSGSMTSDEQTALTGIVLNEDNYDRIPNVTVQLVNEEKSAVTNENGTFQFVDISVGSHEVIVEGDGYSATESTIEVEDGGTRVELFVSN